MRAEPSLAGGGEEGFWGILIGRARGAARVGQARVLGDGSIGQLGFRVGSEHSRGDAGYETARDESLTKHAEVVSRAGDYVAFTGGEGAEAGAGYFFGGFTVGSHGGDVGLAGDFGELGFGGAGAECADADAVGLHFFGQAFGEEEVEGFCGGVSGDVGDALKGGRRGDDEDVAAAAGDHFGEVEAG